MAVSKLLNQSNENHIGVEMTKTFEKETTHIATNRGHTPKTIKRAMRIALKTKKEKENYVYGNSSGPGRSTNENLCIRLSK